MNYLDPIEAFTDEYLRQSERHARGQTHVSPTPSSTATLGDGHFSPLGCDLWARTVAERLVLLLGRDSPGKSP